MKKYLLLPLLLPLLLSTAHAELRFDPQGPRIIQPAQPSAPLEDLIDARIAQRISERSPSPTLPLLAQAINLQLGDGYAQAHPEVVTRIQDEIRREAIVQQVKQLTQFINQPE